MHKHIIFRSSLASATYILTKGATQHIHKQDAPGDSFTGSQLQS